MTFIINLYQSILAFNKHFVFTCQPTDCQSRAFYTKIYFSGKFRDGNSIDFIENMPNLSRVDTYNFLIHSSLFRINTKGKLTRLRDNAFSL